MFWKQQGTGPWGNGGDRGGSGSNPWGGKSGGGGQPSPDLEDLIRQGQDKLKKLFPGGKGSFKGFILLLVTLFVLWSASGLYRVQPDEQGVELLFGKYVKTTEPGLNYWFPSPIGEIKKPKVTLTNQITIGFRGVPNTTNLRDVPAESLMLTGDQNIVDVDFVVQWRISQAGSFLFNIRNPEATVKLAAESAMREAVGQNDLDFITTGGRDSVAQAAGSILQDILDSYVAGISILDLRILQADPPKEVIDAFNDVQRAKQDEERLRNEAMAYKNDIVPRAKGEAARMTESASAQKEKLIREAQGEAKRFESFYETYKENKDVTSRRVYLEAMQEVLSKSEKFLMDDNGQNGVVPYLPLNELLSKKSGGN